MKERERETDKKSKCIYEHKIRERGERDERKAQNQGERNKKRRETRERDNKKKRQPDEDEKRESHPFPPRSPSSNISCLSPYCSLERVEFFTTIKRHRQINLHACLSILN